MSEVILAAAACRTVITEVYQSSSQTTIGANNWGCETTVSPSKYVTSVQTDAAASDAAKPAERPQSKTG